MKLDTTTSAIATGGASAQGWGNAQGRPFAFCATHARAP
jgi:hypothetical protein